MNRSHPFSLWTPTVSMLEHLKLAEMSGPHAFCLAFCSYCQYQSQPCLNMPRASLCPKQLGKSRSQHSKNVFWSPPESISSQPGGRSDSRGILKPNKFARFTDWLVTYNVIGSYEERIIGSRRYKSSRMILSFDYRAESNTWKQFLQAMLESNRAKAKRCTSDCNRPAPVHTRWVQKTWLHAFVFRLCQVLQTLSPSSLTKYKAPLPPPHTTGVPRRVKTRPDVL